MEGRVLRYGSSPSGTIFELFPLPSQGAQVLPLINTDAETIRVEAGPGTGKTFGLVRRVERILHPDGLGVSGKDVLVVAFNRVIAKQLGTEINERLQTF